MKTRTYLELLILIRDYLEQKTIKAEGLCIITKFLRDEKTISGEEEDKIDFYIHKHRPLKGIFFNPDREGYAYFWPPKNKKIRLDWVNHRIKKLSK